MFIIEFYAKHRIGQEFSDHAAELDHIFFGQTYLIKWWNEFRRCRVKWAEIGCRSSFGQADRNGLGVGGKAFGIGKRHRRRTDLAEG